jgi:quinol monooxygenase YgiN
MAASRKLIDENAQMSCKRKPGCRRFAIRLSKRVNDRIFFYQICDSGAAFGTRLPSPHLATFNTTGADLVMNENVAKLHIVFEGSNNKR